MRETCIAMVLIMNILLICSVDILLIWTCLAKKHSWLLDNRKLLSRKSGDALLMDHSTQHRKRHHRVANHHPSGKHRSVIKIHINTKYKMCDLDRRYLSFAIDALEMKRKFRCFPTLSKKLNKLAKGLSPAYLRIGGTPQDFVTFTKDVDTSSGAGIVRKTYPDCKPHFENWKTMKSFELSMEYFSDIAQFAQKNGLNLIFGLNELNHRKPDHSWNEQMSLKLFEYARLNNLPVDWELGNEPNRFAKYGKNYTVTPLQLAADYRKLRKVAKKGQMVGPSIASRNPKALKYLKTFLEGRPGIDALTYHHYFMHQSISTVDKYVEPRFLDELEEKMYSVKLIMNATNTTADLWLGEAGSSCGGGAKNLSDTYASGFLYLSTLGLASTYCHKIVIRQSLYGGYYGMVDGITHDPLPDYWTSVIFKKLVGTVSLKTHKKNEHHRMYTYCSRENADDIVVVAINFGRKSTKFILNNFGQHDVVQYILTPGDNDLQSKHVRLNGKLLQLQSDYNLPSLEGIRTKQPFNLPRRSYGFFVIKDVKSELCRMPT